MGVNVAEGAAFEVVKLVRIGVYVLDVVGRDVSLLSPAHLLINQPLQI